MVHFSMHGLKAGQSISPEYNVLQQSDFINEKLALKSKRRRRNDHLFTQDKPACQRSWAMFVVHSAPLKKKATFGPVVGYQTLLLSNYVPTICCFFC